MGFLALLLGGAALALAGQVVLGGMGNVSLGLMLYALAAMLFVAGATGAKLVGDFSIATPGRVGLTSLRRSRRAQQAAALCAASLGLAGLALWRFGQDEADLLGWALFLTAAGAYVAFGWLVSWKAAPEDVSGARSRASTVAVVALGGMVLLGTLLRVYRLDDVPFGLWVDEAMHGFGAFRGDPPGLPVFLPFVNIPSPFVVFQGLFILVMGQTVEAVRFGSAVLGVATIPLFYLLARRFMARPEALAATFLLTVSFWHLVWSRSGMPGATGPFVAVLAVYLLLRALDSGRLSHYVLAGMALGLAPWFYQSLRLFPVVLVVFLLAVAVAHRGFIRAHAPALVLYAAGCLLVAAPVLQYGLFTSPEEFWGRASEVSVIGRAETMGDALRVLSATTLNHLGMLHYVGDPNGRHNIPGEPMLDVVTGALFVLGLALVLWRWWKPTAVLLLAWTALMLVPGILTLEYETPHSLRAVGMLPPVYLIAGLAIGAVRERWQGMPAGVPAWGLVAVLAVALTASAALNVRAYFHTFPRHPQVVEDFYPRETLIAYRLREDVPEGARVYSTPGFNLHIAMYYLTPGIPLPEFLEAGDVPLPEHPGGVLVFIDGRETDLLDAVRTWYPEAPMRELPIPTNEDIPGVYEVWLAAEDLVGREVDNLAPTRSP